MPQPGEVVEVAQLSDGGRVRFATPTGAPCPRTIRRDGSIDGDGACHACGMGLACPLLDPWADASDFADKVSD